MNYIPYGKQSIGKEGIEAVIDVLRFDYIEPTRCFVCFSSQSIQLIEQIQLIGQI